MMDSWVDEKNFNSPVHIDRERVRGREKDEGRERVNWFDSMLSITDIATNDLLSQWLWLTSQCIYSNGLIFIWVYVCRIFDWQTYKQTMLWSCFTIYVCACSCVIVNIHTNENFHFTKLCAQVWMAFKYDVSRFVISVIKTQIGSFEANFFFR